MGVGQRVKTQMCQVHLIVRKYFAGKSQYFCCRKNESDIRDGVVRSTGLPRDFMTRTYQAVFLTCYTIPILPIEFGYEKAVFSENAYN